MRVGRYFPNNSRQLLYFDEFFEYPQAIFPISPYSAENDQNKIVEESRTTRLELQQSSSLIEQLRGDLSDAISSGTKYREA